MFNKNTTLYFLPFIVILLWSVMIVSCTDYDMEVGPGRDMLENTSTKNVFGPSLTALSFNASSNPYQLIEDVECEIIGDSMAECRVNYLMNDKMLVPHFEFNGSSVYVDGQQIKSDETRLDFRKPVVMTVNHHSFKKNYTVYFHSFTGLPVLWIETEGRQEITSKDEYLRASFKLVKDIAENGSEDVLLDTVNIKGSGNSTWDLPKKPYRLKFDKKVSLLDEPEDKSWLLLANFTDKTFLRNQIAFYMSSISMLDYTPRFHFVELMLNGEYVGTYQLGDKLKISKNRVNVGDGGFLLEVDAWATPDDITFRTDYQDQPYNIKDPDVSVGDENYDYVKNFITTAEQALFSNNFKDEKDGWKEYMDMDSFVEWYLINEIAKNNDAIFFTSCYMNLKRGGKLKMGPLWDFDIAFGNINYGEAFSPIGFWVRNASWYSRLFQDPAFVAKVKERFNYFYGRKDDIMRVINENAQYLRYSIEENNNKWGTFYSYTWPNYNIWGNYMNEVQYMKNWLNERFEWLKSEFDKM